MKHNTALLTAAFLMMSAIPAYAGATISKNGVQMKITCAGASCTARTYSNGKWGPTKVIGPGGSKGLKAALAKYHAQGWK